MNLPFDNQIIQTIAWALALIEALLAIYSLVLNPRHLSNRWVSFYLVIIAINSYFTGMLVGAERFSQAYGPMLVLAATTPLTLSMLLVLTTTLFKPNWFEGHWKWAWWLYGGFMALPAILCLADVMIARLALTSFPLYFSGIEASTYSGGFIVQVEYSRGLLAPYLRGLAYGPVYLALLGLLMKIGFSRKEIPPKSRKLAWILFAINLVAGFASFFAIRWLPASLVNVIVSAIYALAYGYASFHLMVSEHRQTGSLQLRLTATVLIIIAPVLVLVFSTLSGGLMAITGQQVNQNLQETNLEITRNTRLWLQNNAHALENLVLQPSIMNQDVQAMGPVLKAMAAAYHSMYLISIIDKEGRSLARSDEGPQRDYSGQTWYQSAREGSPSSFQGLVEQGVGRPALVATMPIRNPRGEITGVAMSAVDLATFSDQIGVSRFGKTGLVYVVDQENRVVAHPDRTYLLERRNLENEPVVKTLRGGKTGLVRFEDGKGISWLAYANGLDNGWGVVVQQTEEELFTPARYIQRISTGMLVAGLFVLVGLVWWMLRQNLRPIHTLTEAASAVTSGELGRTVSISRQDELGLLAEAFNRMSMQFRQLVDNLETHVAERTRDLERRTAQLEASAQVARSAAAIRDLRLLLAEITKLISDRFGFYHVGIFILDDAGEFAVLQAANSEGGQRMLEHGHKLRVGQVGIVGHVAQTGRPRYALNVGVDAVYFNNPELPETRSEIALPLKVSGQVIGVLDVQSTQPMTFTDEDASVLQVLADQVALAMESARVLDESKRAYQELDTIYGQQTLNTWQERLHRRALAYRYNRIGVFPIEDSEVEHRPDVVPEFSPESLDTSLPSTHSSGGETGSGLGHQVQVPITVRGQVLGTVILRRDSDQKPWTDEDLAVALDAIAQVTPALENARLVEEIQQRAQLESLVGQITAHIQGTLDLDGVMKTAVREIGMAVNASRVQIRLSSAASPVYGSRQAAQESDLLPESDHRDGEGESGNFAGGDGLNDSQARKGNGNPEEEPSC